MSIYEKLEEELKESFAYTLHDKLIFITGFLVDDVENEDLLNFVNYLLYSDHECVLTPNLDLSADLKTWSDINKWQHDNPLPDKSFVESLQEQFNKTELSYRKCKQSICKTCIHYKNDDLLTGSFCSKCSHFSQLNNCDNYEKVN